MKQLYFIFCLFFLLWEPKNNNRYPTEFDRLNSQSGFFLKYSAWILLMTGWVWCYTDWIPLMYAKAKILVIISFSLLLLALICFLTGRIMHPKKKLKNKNRKKEFLWKKQKITGYGGVFLIWSMAAFFCAVITCLG